MNPRELGAALGVFAALVALWKAGAFAPLVELAKSVTPAPAALGELDQAVAEARAYELARQVIEKARAP
jgi:hypothetical protein